ncbi:unnamed protein product [Caenorhabditis brenneri]
MKIFILISLLFAVFAECSGKVQSSNEEKGIQMWKEMRKLRFVSPIVSKEPQNDERRFNEEPECVGLDDCPFGLFCFEGECVFPPF